MDRPRKKDLEDLSYSHLCWFSLPDFSSVSGSRKDRAVHPGEFVRLAKGEASRTFKNSTKSEGRIVVFQMTLADPNCKQLEAPIFEAPAPQ